MTIKDELKKYNTGIIYPLINKKKIKELLKERDQAAGELLRNIQDELIPYLSPEYKNLAYIPDRIELLAVPGKTVTKALEEMKNGLCSLYRSEKEVPENIMVLYKSLFGAVRYRSRVRVILSMPD